MPKYTIDIGIHCPTAYLIHQKIEVDAENDEDVVSKVCSNLHAVMYELAYNAFGKDTDKACAFFAKSLKKRADWFALPESEKQARMEEAIRQAE